MRLDHVSYAAGPEGLGACVQRLGSTIGASFTDGGIHPAFGTRNFVLPMANGIYLEVVDVLDHPAVDSAPFGRAVRERRDAGGGWLGWAIGVDDVTPLEARLGRDSVAGHRRRPDGFELTWRQLGVLDLAVDPQRPYFIQWLTDAAHHPSAGGGSVSLAGLEIAGDEASVEHYLGASTDQPLDGIAVRWLPAEDDETGIVAAVFDTQRGSVRID